MTVLDLQTPVGELVSDRPARSRLFEQLRIDYCCGGKLPLAEACEKRGLAPEEVLRQLEQADVDVAAGDHVDADAMGLAELADHIVATHHEYLRVELPRLDFLTRKVAAVHGEREPRLNEIRDIFLGLKRELLLHTRKEEQVLFPAVRQIDRAKTAPDFPFGSLANPIAAMESEHDDAGDALVRFEERTGGYTPPEWACNTFRALYDGLRELEQDMHQHVHKENNILFPKALERERALRGE